MLNWLSSKDILSPPSEPASPETRPQIFGPLQPSVNNSTIMTIHGTQIVPTRQRLYRCNLLEFGGNRWSSSWDMVRNTGGARSAEFAIVWVFWPPKSAYGQERVKGGGCFTPEQSIILWFLTERWPIVNYDFTQGSRDYHRISRAVEVEVRSGTMGIGHFAELRG